MKLFRKLLLTGIALAACYSRGWSTPVISSATWAGALLGNADTSTATVVDIWGSNFLDKPYGPAPWVWYTGDNLPGGSTQPTTLGTLQTWSFAEHIESTTTAGGGYVYSGTYALGSTDQWWASNQIFRVRLDTSTSLIGYGDQWFANYKHLVTYTYLPGNFKWIRWWATNGTSPSGNQYPNQYISTQGTAESARVMLTEFLPDGSTAQQIGGSFKHPGQTPGTWVGQQWMLQLNSANNLADGFLQSLQIIPSTGSLYATSSTWRTDTVACPGFPSQMSIEDDASNFTPDGNAYMDDIYADRTFARAFSLDVSSYGTVSPSNQKINMLIPKLWTDNHIQAYFHQGNFNSGENIYFIVCDKTNACSGGLPVQVGATNPVPPSPPAAGTPSLMLRGPLIPHGQIIFH